MAGFDYGAKRFQPLGARFSSLLDEQKDYNTGTHTGGLAHVLTQTLKGLSARKDEKQLQSAQEALDMGLREGGAQGAVDALSALQKNPYARRLSSQLTQEKLRADQERAAREQEFAQQQQMMDRRFGHERDLLNTRISAQMAQPKAPPSGYRATPAGELEPIPGGPADPANRPPQPIPGTVMKTVASDVEALASVGAMNQNLEAFRQSIDAGDLDLGRGKNLEAQFRNMVGFSDEQSRNFASFRSYLEKLRNDSLRLNNGVQTEGDAQRAWNELITNLNDEELVRQRLQEIQQLNNQAAQIKQRKVQMLYGNYGQQAPELLGEVTQPAFGPPEFERQSQPPAQNAPQRTASGQQPQVGEVRKGHVYIGGNPADPASWAKVNQ